MKLRWEGVLLKELPIPESTAHDREQVLRCSSSSLRSCSIGGTLFSMQPTSLGRQSRRRREFGCIHTRLLGIFLREVSLGFESTIVPAEIGPTRKYMKVLSADSQTTLWTWCLQERDKQKKQTHKHIHMFDGMCRWVLTFRYGLSPRASVCIMKVLRHAAPHRRCKRKWCGVTLTNTFPRTRSRQTCTQATKRRSSLSMVSVQWQLMFALSFFL